MSKHNISYCLYNVVSVCLKIMNFWGVHAGLSSVSLLYFSSHLLTFYQHKFLGYFFLRSILKHRPWHCRECIPQAFPQAPLPFAVTLIKSASLKSGFRFVSFFEGQLLADDRPAPPLCAPAQPSFTVSRLEASCIGGEQGWGDGQQSMAGQESSFSIELTRERNNSRKKSHESRERLISKILSLFV